MKPIFFSNIILSSLVLLSIPWIAWSKASTETLTKKILVLGDSLSEGYGVARESSYPEILSSKIKETHKNWQVVNASISGSTSASGPGRLKWQLKNKPDLLLLILGANDGLRGLKVEETEKNLNQTIAVAKENGIKIILFGMKMPPNYGEKYQKDFESIFTKLAKQHNLPFVPFLLDGVAGDPKMNLADGIHPNEAGHKKIAENVFNGIKGNL